MASITVIGGGIFGLSCAWELTRRGAQVTLIEATRIGAGSSGGTVGALAPHAPDNWNTKKQIQLDALMAASDWWAEIAKTGQCDPGYLRSGRIQPIPDQRTLERCATRIEAARQNWPEWAQMSLTDAPETPLICNSPTGFWLHDTLTARLSPRAAGKALTAALTAAGAKLIIGEHAGIDDICGPALWATGAAGLDALSRDLNRPIGNGVKGQSALLRLPDGPDLRNAPQLYADGLHIIPHADGCIGIGSTSERDFADGMATDHLLDDVLTRARTLCPLLAQAEVADRWAGIRPRAASRAPLLGAWPGRPGHFVANGGFKIGFGMAPAIAAMMADLILDQTDRIPSGFRLA